jgi:DNA-directed RNA polymerase sigma subunit (sigma70/sigma32)
VDNLLGGLTEKESTVIKMYYGLDGFEASGINMISSRLGVTSQRVSRAHATALEKLKNMAKKL